MFIKCLLHFIIEYRILTKNNLKHVKAYFDYIGKILKKVLSLISQLGSLILLEFRE